VQIVEDQKFAGDPDDSNGTGRYAPELTATIPLSHHAP
jgi:hypothetical protein